MNEETVGNVLLIVSIFVGDVRAKGSPRRMLRILHAHLENRRLSKVSKADHPTPHCRGANLWFAWANAQHSSRNRENGLAELTLMFSKVSFADPLPRPLESNA